MIAWFQSGGVMMWPLLVVAVGIGWLAVRTGVALARRDPEHEAVERSLQAILFWGVMSLPLGVLGTVAGLVLMAEAITLAGQVEAPLVWGGVGVSLVTLIFALVIFLAAGMVWFGLRGWHLRRIEAAASPA